MRSIIIDALHRLPPWRRTIARKDQLIVEQALMIASLLRQIERQKQVVVLLKGTAAIASEAAALIDQTDDAR